MKRKINLKISQEEYLLGLLGLVNYYLEGEGNLPYDLEEEALWNALDEVVSGARLAVAKVARKLKARHNARLRDELLWEIES